MCSARIRQPAILVVAAIVLTSVTGSAARADSVLITNLADSEIASVGFNDTSMQRACRLSVLTKSTGSFSEQTTLTVPTGSWRRA